MTGLTLFLLGTFIFSGSAWLIQKPFIRPLLNTRRYYGPRTGAVIGITNELVVPGITIPLDDVTLEAIYHTSTNETQNIRLDIFAAKAFFEGNFAGQPKTNANAFDRLQKVYVNDVVANKQNLPADYKYFGNGNTEEILKQLLLNNPFFTSALQYNRQSTWSISSYAQGDASRYSRLITAYDASFPRVNVKLDRNDLTVYEYKVFSADGKDITSKYTKEEAIKLLMFTLTFYAEVVHAAIHIYDYINVLGLFTSTFGLKTLEVSHWAASYLSNVPKKYSEVVDLLFNPDKGALVSYKGFSADRTKVLQFVADDILKPWLHLSTVEQFLDEFAFGYIDPSQRRIFLVDFRIQLGLIPEFASELTAAIKKATTTDAEYGKINTKLEHYYSSLGKDISNIKDVEVWIRLMSAVNILHGSTFSFSRYLATPEFLPYRTTASNYNITDVEFAIIVLGTTMGLASDRYVYTSNLLTDSAKDIQYVLDKYDKKILTDSAQDIQNVLDKYDKKTNELKVNSFNRIQKDTEMFKNYGWILTDFGPDLIDNKQLTLATYV